MLIGRSNFRLHVESICTKTHNTAVLYTTTVFHTTAVALLYAVTAFHTPRCRRSPHRRSLHCCRRRVLTGNMMTVIYPATVGNDAK